MAPNASILLVEANSSSNSDLLAAVDYAAAHANVVSMSWGGSEFSSETNLSQYESHFIHPGVVFVASSGDSGRRPEWPAISPNIVAVGGTTLQVDAGGNYLGETSWSGSTGGLSSYESQPAYQKGVVTQSSTKRANPDVAYNANPNVGFAVYDSTTYHPSYPSTRNGQYGWFEVGGTSAGAPQWAALLAIANQGRSAANKSPINATDPQEVLKVLYANSPGAERHHERDQYRKAEVLGGRGLRPGHGPGHAEGKPGGVGPGQRGHDGHASESTDRTDGHRHSRRADHPDLELDTQ